MEHCQLINHKIISSHFLSIVARTIYQKNVDLANAAHLQIALRAEVAYGFLDLECIYIEQNSVHSVFHYCSLDYLQ